MGAGHETTATTTAAVLYCIAAHPEVEARVVQELEAVLGGWVGWWVGGRTARPLACWAVPRRPSLPRVQGRACSGGGALLHSSPRLALRHPDAPL